MAAYLVRRGVSWASARRVARLVVSGRLTLEQAVVLAREMDRQRLRQLLRRVGAPGAASTVDGLAEAFTALAGLAPAHPRSGGGRGRKRGGRERGWPQPLLF